MSNSLRPHGRQHSPAQLFATPCTAASQASMLITNCQSLLKLMSMVLVIQPSHPLLSPSPPTFNLSLHQGLFQWASLCLRWPKYWSFSITPSNEYSGLISFRMDWLDLLAVQGTLKESSPTSQFKSINSSVLSFIYGPTLPCIHDDYRENLALTYGPLSVK